jgi:hypothetical protein
MGWNTGGGGVKEKLQERLAKLSRGPAVIKER